MREGEGGGGGGGGGWLFTVCCMHASAFLRLNPRGASVHLESARDKRCEGAILVDISTKGKTSAFAGVEFSTFAKISLDHMNLHQRTTLSRSLTHGAGKKLS